MNSLTKMKKRLSPQYQLHDKYIVQAKYKSFKDALDKSYQAEFITINKGELNESHWRCLINPSKLTEQYDKKVISIDYEAGLEEGSVFFWDRTNAHWIVDLQQHTEEAYFRGTITRANYELDIDDRKYWASLRGPVETAADWNQKHNTVWNNLNYSNVLKIAKDNKTVPYFSRHQVIKLKMTYPNVDTGEIMEEWHNWKVVATDKYTFEKIMEVYLDEYFDNEMEDKQITPPPPPEPPAEEDIPYIKGPTAVHCFDTDVSFAVVNAKNGKWEISSPKLAKFVSQKDDSCVIDILAAKAATLTLTYKLPNSQIDYKIRVDSL